MNFFFKFIFLPILIYSPIASNAQTEKGRFIYGGTLYANTNVIGGNSVSIGIQPQFGVFPVKNFAVLGILHFSLGYTTLSPYYYGINVGAGPELRYYAGGEKVKFFVHANVIPHLSQIGGSYFAIHGGGGPGVSMFPNSNISINTSLFFAGYRMFGNSHGNLMISFTTVINGLFGGKPKV